MKSALIIHPLAPLDIIMALDSYEVSYCDLNIGGREYTLPTELWPFSTRFQRLFRHSMGDPAGTRTSTPYEHNALPFTHFRHSRHRLPGSTDRARTGRTARPYITTSRNRAHQMVCHFRLSPQ